MTPDMDKVERCVDALLAITEEMSDEDGDLDSEGISTLQQRTQSLINALDPDELDAFLRLSMQRAEHAMEQFEAVMEEER